MTWLEQLRKRKEDRGMMAVLRCALIETKKHRAWPALHRLGVDVNDRTAAIVAGLYASHPEEQSTGNLGNTCAEIERRRDGGNGAETKTTPTERRFQHLLAAEKGDELFGRVIRIVLLAKAQGVSVNFVQLEKDLWFWNERTRQQWASAFWTPHEIAEVNDTQGELK